MNNTITLTLTDEQMKALQSGQSITIEPHKPAITKWEPIKGNYYIEPSNGYVTSKHSTMENYRLAGLEYSTQTQAEQSAKALRSYARQLAWLAENDDGWIADWNNIIHNKYYVYFDIINNEYDTAISFQDKHLSTIYMSEVNAEKLCKLLNDKIVEF